MNNPENNTPQPKYSPEELQACLNMLDELSKGSDQLAHLTEEQRINLMMAAGRISRPDKQEIRKRAQDRRTLKLKQIDAHQRKVRASTGIRSARTSTVFVAPAQIQGPEALTPKDNELIRPRNCYVCKAEFSRLHFFMTRCARSARSSIMPSGSRRHRWWGRSRLSPVPGSRSGIRLLL